MRVKCVICDTTNNIDSSSLIAKRMRNKRTTTYMCPECHDRIEKKTKERVATGNFRLYKEEKKEKHLS